jgi:hypothetical protein
MPEAGKTANVLPAFSKTIVADKEKFQARPGNRLRKMRVLKLETFQFLWN